MDAFEVIWTRDGIKGFLTMRALTIMPNSALCWLLYEFFSTCCLLMFFICYLLMLIVVMCRQPFGLIQSQFNFATTVLVVYLVSYITTS